MTSPQKLNHNIAVESSVVLQFALMDVQYVINIKSTTDALLILNTCKIEGISYKV